MCRLLETSFSLALLFLFSIPSSHSNQDEKKPIAYLITAASNASQRGREPTWIGFVKWGRTIHIPANEAINEVYPGTYRLNHFDYGKSKLSGWETRVVRGTLKKIKVSHSAIYYLGRFELSKKKTALVHDPQLIRDACSHNPEIFERLPVRFLFIEELENDYRIDCKTETLAPVE